MPVDDDAPRCGWLGPDRQVCTYAFKHAGLHSYEVPPTSAYGVPVHAHAHVGGGSEELAVPAKPKRKRHRKGGVRKGVKGAQPGKKHGVRRRTKKLMLYCTEREYELLMTKGGAWVRTCALRRLHRLTSATLDTTPAQPARAPARRPEGGQVAE